MVKMATDKDPDQMAEVIWNGESFRLGCIEDIRETIRKIQVRYPYNVDKILKKNSLFNVVLNEIMNWETDKLFDKRWSEKLYWFLNDIHEFPLCKTCGINRVKFVNAVEGYRSFCCSKCAQNSKIVREKIDETKIKKHGSLEEARRIAHEKGKETCLDKYGVENVFQSEAIKEKIRKSNQTKYGCDYGVQSDEIKQKIKISVKEKYGVDWITQAESFKDNAKCTILEKYGVENVAKSEEIQEKIRKINLEKYGVEYPQQSDEIRMKSHKTMLERYGVEYNGQRDEFRNAAALNARKKSYEQMLLNEYDLPEFSLEWYLENGKGECEFKCKKCGNVFSAIHKDGIHYSCPICYPRKLHGKSYEEKELVGELRNIYSDEIIENDRTILDGLELDIYVPAKKIGIEFDGLYWHSSDNVENDYHVKKTEHCEKQGIQLIHVFENEWQMNKKIVMSMIKSKLGMIENKIYARKCKVNLVESKDFSIDFQNANHIQGKAGSSVDVGLFYNGEMVALMTFGKPRFNKSFDWEMIRFCTKCGYSIIGGASKLLKWFELVYKPKNLLTYCDRRWSIGSLYYKLGFDLDHISGPNYWYWKQELPVLESRVKFQKHKLEGLLENFDPDKTEFENMKMNGYNRIYDCGNFVFVKRYY